MYRVKLASGQVLASVNDPGVVQIFDTDVAHHEAEPRVGDVLHGRANVDVLARRLRHQGRLHDRVPGARLV